MDRHELKIWPQFFDDVKSGKKKYEIRYGDRDYKVGDELFLREYNADSQAYSGRVLVASIVHMTKASYEPGGDLLATRACVLGIEVVP